MKYALRRSERKDKTNWASHIHVAKSRSRKKWPMVVASLMLVACLVVELICAHLQITTLSTTKNTLGLFSFSYYIQTWHDGRLVDVKYAHARFDDLDHDARSQWVGKGNRSTLHALGNEASNSIKLATTVSHFYMTLALQTFIWLDHPVVTLKNPEKNLLSFYNCFLILLLMLKNHGRKKQLVWHATLFRRN